MPELPEVETTVAGIKPYLIGITIKKLVVRNSQLRWPVTQGIEDTAKDLKIENVNRRAKYIIVSLTNGSFLIHLGMSGSLRLITNIDLLRKHDHIQMYLSNGHVLTFHDPRRFGCWLWSKYNHALLDKLGPEPLSPNFGGEYLWNQARKRTAPVKSFIMDSRIVVGVGNIYANEALFESGIKPHRRAGKVSLKRYKVLAENIKIILSSAIEQGGTTLRDFTNSRGEPGYFEQSLSVYGRAGKACVKCKQPLKEIRLAQRSSVFCRSCQS